MANISYEDKMLLSKCFINSGFVLDFSNRTFEMFVFDSVGTNIYDQKYNAGGDSKGKKLMYFLEVEPNYIAAKLIEDLYKHKKEHCPQWFQDVEKDIIQEEKIQNLCKQLKNTSGIGEVAVFKEVLIDDYEKKETILILLKEIEEALRQKKFQAGLDRLHTFVVKYVRYLCEKYKIDANQDKPLHSIFGEYVKHLESNKLIESEMTLRILKSSISVLESFNHVRNNKSLAHDNQILNYQESHLIFKNILNCLEFMHELETSRKPVNTENEEIPF